MTDLLPGTDFPRLEAVPIAGTDAAMLADWIGDDRARPWLDLGGGRQLLGARELYLLLASPTKLARLFRVPGTTVPIGFACLNDVTNLMGSAEVWGVRGAYADGGPRNSALSSFLQILATGFIDRQRTVIGSWGSANNGLSVIMHKRLGMTQGGRARARHVMGGVAHDRLLFDMTAAEFGARYPDVPAESGRSWADLHPAAAAAGREMADA